MSQWLNWHFARFLRWLDFTYCFRLIHFIQRYDIFLWVLGFEGEREEFLILVFHWIAMVLGYLHTLDWLSNVHVAWCLQNQRLGIVAKHWAPLTWWHKIESIRNIGLLAMQSLSITLHDVMVHIEWHLPTGWANLICKRCCIWSTTLTSFPFLSSRWGTLYAPQHFIALFFGNLDLLHLSIDINYLPRRRLVHPTRNFHYWSLYKISKLLIKID